MPKTGVPDTNNVAANIVCHRFSDDKWVQTSLYVPSETELTIYVNQQELVAILCTPTKLDFLVLGFLYAEEIISGIDDVASMRMCDDVSLVDVRLVNPDFQLPTQRTLTSGFGAGTTFKHHGHGQKVNSNFVITPMEVLSLMEQLLEQMELYKLSGGVHTSALADTGNLLVMAEDIGRHNTLDKIQGECLFRKLPTQDRLLLSTGRISSEMLLKAAKMGLPIIVSRHSPTKNAVSLAADLGITLVGHARGEQLQVYSHPERLGCPAS